jgi:serine/threonine protein kinase
MTPRPALPPGTVLDGRFELRDRLGAGAFGAVYRARQLAFGKPLREVALKLFEADRVNEGNAREVFGDALTLWELTETRRCPAEVARHLIQVYDVGLLRTPQGEQAFMTMKLVPGKKTLLDAVRRWRAGGMPLATALGFLRQILVPLAWMHTLDSPVVHGDLKPDNVLLAEDDVTLLLADFGLAAPEVLGSFGGAIKYQAPETLLGGRARAPADVFCVGIIWYEMLTGRHPFEDAGLEALAEDDMVAFRREQHEARKWPFAGPAAGRERVVPAAELNEDLTRYPALEEMLRRCLAYRPSDRYPNARILLQDLDRFLAGQPVLPTPPLPAAAPPVGDVALPAQDALTLLRDAQLLAERGDRAGALRLAEQAAEKDPDSLDVRLGVARVQAACGRTDLARRACAHAQSLLGNRPTDAQRARVLEALADVFAAEGQRSTEAGLREQARRLRAVRK